MYVCMYVCIGNKLKQRITFHIMPLHTNDQNIHAWNSWKWDMAVIDNTVDTFLWSKQRNDRAVYTLYTLQHELALSTRTSVATRKRGVSHLFL